MRTAPGAQHQPQQQPPQQQDGNVAQISYEEVRRVSLSPLLSIN